MERQRSRLRSAGDRLRGLALPGPRRASVADRGHGPRPLAAPAATASAPSPSASRRPGSRPSSSTIAASATATASRISSSPRRQLEDWAAAIAFARSLPGLDPARVATFGSSMGGGNALAAAAADERRRRRDQPGARSSTSSPRRTGLLSAVAARMLLAAALRPPPAGGRRAATRPPSSTRPAARPAGGGSSPIGEDSRWRNRVSSRWLLGAPFRTGRHAARPALSLARLRRRGRPGRPARPGDRAPLGGAARRAAPLPGRRPLRHLRRPRARGGRRRPGRLPPPPPASRRRADTRRMRAMAVGQLVTRADDDAAAARRDHRHVAVQGALGLRVRGDEVEAAGGRLEDDALLGHRQRRAEAAADAAAEGQPLVGAGLAVVPALGPELEGVLVEVLAVVEEEDADQDRGVGAARRTRRAARAASPGGRRSGRPAASASSR